MLVVIACSFFMPSMPTLCDPCYVVSDYHLASPSLPEVTRQM